ncbi:hypothetical protein [Streptomyces litmocidini]|uniref:hypothetical protein n=1 Tax=Streptomyces litmocidini TaxID=67318 RepID=UPI0036F97CE4
MLPFFLTDEYGTAGPDDAVDRQEERLDEDQLGARLGEGREQAVLSGFELPHGDDVLLRVHRVPARVVDPDEDRHQVRMCVEYVCLPTGREVPHLVARGRGVRKPPGVQGASVRCRAGYRITS